MNADRRRTHRIPCDLPVEWRRGWLTVDARVRDFDPEGMFLETSHTVQPGQTMDLVVTLPDAQLRVTGVARYVGVTRHGRGIGVAILAITTEDTEKLRAYYRRERESVLAQMPAPRGVVTSAR